MKGNGRVQGKIARVTKEIILEWVKRGVKVGEENFKEPTIGIEDAMETSDQKKVKPALMIVNKGFAGFLTRFTRRRRSMTKGRVTGSNSNATKNGVAIRLM